MIFLLSVYNHKSYYINTFNPIVKSDENHNNKENKCKHLIDEAFEKFNWTVNISIIRNKEAYLLHHILGYLKELWDYYGAEPIFTHAISLKGTHESDFFTSAKFVIVHS